jgi:large subunit ribosomal protein L15
VKLHEVKAPKGARKGQRRVGRGTGSGTGKTAGKGTKGQLARSGPGLPAWFEGGQTPLHMRLPKLRGFKPPRRTKYVAVNVGQLKEYADGGKVTPDLLKAKGLRVDQPVKVLGDGGIDQALEVHAHAFSATARAAIEGAGGKVVLIEAK